MLKSLFLRKLYFAFLLVRKGGWHTILHYIRSQIFSRTTYVWLAKDLGSSDSPIPTAVRYSLQPASPDIFKKLLLNSLDGESGQTVFEILRRVSFYERGFDSCYVALTDSGEVCHMAWLLYPRQNKLIRAHYPWGAHELKDDEAMLENLFTFPGHRNKGVSTSVTHDLAEIARSQGFSQMLAYADKENGTSLRSLSLAGFHAFDEEQEVKMLFIVWRRKWTS